MCVCFLWSNIECFLVCIMHLCSWQKWSLSLVCLKRDNSKMVQQRLILKQGTKTYKHVCLCTCTCTIFILLVHEAIDACNERCIGHPHVCIRILTMKGAYIEPFGVSVLSMDRCHFFVCVLRSYFTG